ncbi:aquaporin [Arthrobacter sp. TMN-37]
MGSRDGSTPYIGVEPLQISTSFANPAVTVGRTFTDTFAGITPSSGPGFVATQLIGAAVGIGLLLVLFSSAAETADDAAFPHDRQLTRN